MSYRKTCCGKQSLLGPLGETTCTNNSSSPLLYFEKCLSKNGITLLDRTVSCICSFNYSINNEKRILIITFFTPAHIAPIESLVAQMGCLQI